MAGEGKEARPPAVQTHLVRGWEKIALPDAAAPVDDFTDAARKRVVAAMLEPESYTALLQGLQHADITERRQWWKLAKELADVLPKDGAGVGGTRITFVQNVPAPPREDGPIGRRSTTTIDVTPPAAR